MTELSVEQKNIAWEQFIKEGILKKGYVRPVIADSWLRCKQYGVDPFLQKGLVVSNRLLANKLKKSQKLLQISRPFMKTLYEFVAGSGFLVILYDQDGIVLEMIGDPDVKILSEYSKLSVGSDLSEKRMGTNAPGTVLVERKPVQVVAKEHYCTLFHEWTCSAAPIFSVNGELLGVLNVNGNYKMAHPHTLGMVVAAVQAIENELRLVDIYNELRISHGYSNTIMGSISEGLFFVNTEGKITQINAIAKKMLDYKEVNPNISSYSYLQKVFEALKTGSTLNNTEISNHKGERLIITAVPIKDVLENLTGAVVICKESRAVHRLVANIAGANANFTFSDLIGKSDQFLEAVSLAVRASQSESTILLQGESGTGKDLFAQSIHNNSNHKNGPFIAINCAALPHELVGSELFGYEEGAFTGAQKGGRIGKFELANGGTIFLDEIGDMPLDLQAHLLRVLEEKKITRLGGQSLIPVDVRVIVATNKNLKELVSHRNFREDLYYRLNVLTITLPPLRKRGDDVLLLSDYFMGKLKIQIDKNIEKLDKDLKKLFREYQWPGNVRQLQNLLEKAMHLADGNTLSMEHFPEIDNDGNETNFDSENCLKDLVEEYEKKILLYNLNKYNWNITKVARTLGVARNTLYYKISKMGIDCPNNITLSKK